LCAAQRTVTPWLSMRSYPPRAETASCGVRSRTVMTIASGQDRPTVADSTAGMRSTRCAAAEVSTRASGWPTRIRAAVRTCAAGTCRVPVTTTCRTTSRLEPRSAHAAPARIARMMPPKKTARAALARRLPALLGSPRCWPRSRPLGLASGSVTGSRLTARPPARAAPARSAARARSRRQPPW
jgi:hypothetical protein